jgi:Domain of unknown function (DUF4276)
MARLLVHVEGQTEESFVNEILRDHLVAKGFSTVSARIVGNARLRYRRGGIKSWPSVKKEIVTHLREDPACIATTMVDYYGLPHVGDAAWPGRAQAASLTSWKKPGFIDETALLEDVISTVGPRFDFRRFVPFVVTSTTPLSRRPRNG